MKRRNRVGRQRFSSRQKPLALFANRKSQKRKTFSFERLEDRLAFSTSPLELPTAGISNSTPEGAAAILQRELQWAMVQAADATNPVLPQNIFLALPNDPLFPDPNNPENQGQWHLWNIGQEVGNPFVQPLFGVPGEDINVVPVWQGTGLERPYTGEGILVAVFDSGIQLFHPDLSANIHPTLRLNATTGTNNGSPSLIDPSGYHGTAVAGLIGAVANNGIGGTGVAPGVTLVPIRRDFTNPLEEATAFQWVMQNNIDITNNSWGPNHAFDRHALPLTPDELEILRNSAIHGRDGLGIIHVFSSGNNGGPSITTFGINGNYDSSSYRPYANSRYTITVTGVDHDGLYINADGTFTTYPTAGPNVLVAAPTGSNGAILVAEDDGYGSGLWTTDLVGDFGFNAEPSSGGFDPDQDPWPDPNYTSRFNGTSASAPLVTGVIALMLEANPNLTYRDVQEILLRSARQNAQFEFPASGGLGGPFASLNTWQTNQIGPFRNPDPWIPNSFQSRSQSLLNPLSDPNIDGAFFGFDEFAPDRLDFGRQVSSHYEAQPALFTNGAGYTVSQGYGVYSEQIGYGHGVVDAALAVQMAEKWHVLGQNSAPGTERTFTTSVVVTGANIPAAEKGADPPGGNRIIVPGGWYGLGGFIAYWNEYFAADDPANPADGPFSNYTGPPAEQRGESYIDFAVPPDQAIDVEWVEVRVDISGPAADLDFLRLFLVSPDGTQSELNNFYLDEDFSTPFTLQSISRPPAQLDPAGDIDVDGGDFVWTFATNRSWGESTNTSIIIDPVTGEPLLAEDPFFGPLGAIFRDWELHVENWSNSNFGFGAVEVVWHGKPIANGALDPNWNVARAQRVQGFVGIDSNNDEQFNFGRYVQTISDSDGDPDTIRLLDVQRQLDFQDVNLNGVYDPAFDIINQEAFAENILVEAYRVVNPGLPSEVIDATPTAQFLTGADGNYYFDLDPTQTYDIRITDLNAVPRIALDDALTPASAPAGLDYMPHYLSEWRITPDWYFAPDRDNPIVPGNNPGEILYGMTDANGDGVLTEGPLPFMDADGNLDGNPDPIPMAVKNINFLLKQDDVPDQVQITGTVYLDFGGDGNFDPATDAPVPGVRVYFDQNRNDNFDAGEQFMDTAADGTYSFTITATAAGTFAVGVDPASSPTSPWVSTEAGGLVKSVYAAPGDAPSIVNFFLAPPNAAPGVTVGGIQGFVFNDLDADGIQDGVELGVEGIRVFVDTNENGIWDNNGDAVPDPGEEIGVLTGPNGSFFLTNVPAGSHKVTVVTAGTTYQTTIPVGGVRLVTLDEGETEFGVRFGLDNLADRDWGDLPLTYGTTSGGSPVGPSHQLYNHFRLGANISGEINGQPSAGANADTSDDGIVVVGGTLHPGVNTLRVTVAGVGGSLTGWIDWNKSGTFEASERLIWTNESGTLLGGEANLGPGTHNLRITAPAVDGPLAARFRWGEHGLDFSGPASIGEVEDYLLDSSAIALLAGDYNNDNIVDGGDYLVWRKYFGSNTTLPNDTTPGMVTQEDYVVWQNNFGNTSPGAGAGGGGVASALTPAANETAVAGSGSSAITASLRVDSLNSGTASPVVISSEPLAAVSPQTQTAASAADSTPSALFASFTVDSSTSDLVPSASVAQADSSVVAAEESDANLLLLDQAWADLDDDGDDDVPLADRFGGEEESVSDFALAAVFENESNWWSM